MKISDLKVGDAIQIEGLDDRVVVDITDDLLFLKSIRYGILHSVEKTDLKNYTIVKQSNKEQVKETFKPIHPKEDIKQEFYFEFEGAYYNDGVGKNKMTKGMTSDVWKWIENKFLN